MTLPALDNDRHYMAQLVNDYQLSGRYHPYTCDCPSPIRDIDPPKAFVIAHVGLKLLCCRCGSVQDVSSEMVMHCNTVMALPDDEWGEFIPRGQREPRPTLAYAAWKASVLAGTVAGAFFVASFAMATTVGAPVAVLTAIVGAFASRHLLFASNKKATERINHG